MDAEFGIYADEILYQLRSTNFSNEYWDMNNTERLKLLNEINMSIDKQMEEKQRNLYTK